ncbi:MAG: hypothetical protein ACUZ9M_03710 [Candidatus Scalindua sp.]
MGDLFKKLDEIMTGDFVRKLGGAVCLVAVIILGLGFVVGAKSVLKTMKGPAVAVEATDEAAGEVVSEDAEEVDEDDYEDEDDYDE